MAYCVNCGVKMTPPEKVCPLCGLEAYNPREPLSDAKSRYPEQMERTSVVNRRFVASIISLLLIVPTGICLLLNLLLVKDSPWSVFVIGSLALFFVAALLPILMHKPHPLFCLTLDTAAISLFLLMIVVFITPGNWRWYLILALPITIAAGGFASLMVFLSRFSYFRPILRLVAYSLMLIGIYLLGLEMLLHAYIGTPWAPFWSWIPFAACVMTALFFLFLNRSRKWQEEITKKIFI
ncbi:MAG TPA: hypothetical protein DCY74_04950 [Clostridiales bacterium]|jgi:hypothetical protein|nr:hypothetical protein [Clostridiales bacterium]HBE13498.1 hypothetical protein [Clostridiales bacterium]